MKISLRSLESAKSHAWPALRVYVLACSRAWCAYVLTCLRAYVLGVLSWLACLRAWHAWRAYVLSVHACLRAWCTCARACVRACVRACTLVLMKCFIFLHVWVLGVLFCLNTFQYLNLKILTAKNLCDLLSWTYFLFTFWYQLLKLFETNFNEN